MTAHVRAQMEEPWAGDGMQYWDGNAAGLSGAVYYPPPGEDGARDAYLGNGNGAYTNGVAGGAKGGANGYGPRRAVPAFPPSMAYPRQPRLKEKKRRCGNSVIPDIARCVVRILVSRCMA